MDRDAFDPRFCWRCFDGAIDAAGTATLIDAADDRWDALRMLGDISDPRALAPIVNRLGDGTPMTFFAQFAVPETEGRMANLFVDPGHELNGQPESGPNAVVDQPGTAAEPHIRLETGPTYASTESATRRFVPRMRFRFVERRALLHEGLDPADLGRSRSRGQHNFGRHKQGRR